MFSNSTSRSSRPKVFCKKISAIFTGNHLCWIPFLIKLERVQDRYFPVNIAEFLRTAFFRTPLVAPSELPYWIPKRNSHFDKLLSSEECSLPIEFAFNMSIPCSECTIQPEAMFFRRRFSCCHNITIFLVCFMQKKFKKLI